MSTPPPGNLDRQMNARRIDLDMSWGEVADAAGLSESGLRAVRTGRNNASDLTKRRIENALGWVEGSVDDIGAGGRATVKRDEVEQLRAEIAELRAEVKRLTAKRKRSVPESSGRNLADTDG